MNAKTTREGFFDPNTYTITYVFWDQSTRRAAIIDPVLDYDFKSGHTGTKSADWVITYVKDNQLGVDWILETHAHADHLSGARYMQTKLGGRIAIGENTVLMAPIILSGWHLFVIAAHWKFPWRISGGCWILPPDPRRSAAISTI